MTEKTKHFRRANEGQIVNMGFFLRDLGDSLYFIGADGFLHLKAGWTLEKLKEAVDQHLDNTGDPVPGGVAPETVKRTLQNTAKAKFKPRSPVGTGVKGRLAALEQGYAELRAELEALKGA